MNQAKNASKQTAANRHFEFLQLNKKKKKLRSNSNFNKNGKCSEGKQSQ